MSTSVKFGVHVGPQLCSMAELRGAWKASEDLGYDWISTFDHFYPSMLPPEGSCFEALTTHAALAATTTRPRLGCLVYCAPFRHPGLMANAGATIDHLSDGRFELGIGAGWQVEEHETYGFPFDPPALRLRRLAEVVEIVRLLWTEDSVDYDGEFYTLKGATCDPKPVQSTPRIWIGASGEKTGLKLAGRLGDGWNLVMPSPEDFARKLAIVKEASPHPDRLAVGVNVALVGGTDDKSVVEAVERRFGPVAEQIRAATLSGSAEQMADHVGRYTDAGAEWIVLAIRAPFELDVLERFALEVVPPFRSGSRPSTGAVVGSVDAPSV